MGDYAGMPYQDLERAVTAYKASVRDGDSIEARTNQLFFEHLSEELEQRHENHRWMMVDGIKKSLAQQKERARYRG